MTGVVQVLGERDWLSAQPARGGGSLPGRKPVSFVAFLFDALGMQPGDSLVDVFPGTGVIGRAWAEVSRAAAEASGDASPGDDADAFARAVSDGPHPRGVSERVAGVLGRRAPTWTRRRSASCSGRRRPPGGRMNCPHYEFTLCAACFRALTPSQQAAIQQADGSVAAFRAGDCADRILGLPVERPVKARGKR